MSSNIYDFSVKRIDGKQISLSEFKGKVLLLVNVASQCGLTPQYDSLEKIYKQYSSEGFEVLGFPANEFGAQEPGTNLEIQEFCQTKFGVKFPMFEKIVVKGAGQHPLYHFLTETMPQAQLGAQGNSFEEKLKNYGVIRSQIQDILWNFEKFLVNKSGEVIARFAPDVSPEDPIIKKAIEAALN